MRRLDDGEFRLNAYAIASRLNLFSNFTFFLEHPIDLDPAASNGDQFEQAERRKVLGLAASRAWNVRLGAVDTVNTLGLQVRQDRLDPVGLYRHGRPRAQRRVTQESEVRQTSVAAVRRELDAMAALAAQRRRPARRSLRLQGRRARSRRTAARRTAASSRPSCRWSSGPGARPSTSSTTARASTATMRAARRRRVAAKSRDPVDPVTPLVRSKGGELGVRTEIVPGLQSSLALWQLKLASELIFVGDAGETEPSRASRRRGIEWNNHYRATPWLLLDADFAGVAGSLHRRRSGRQLHPRLDRQGGVGRGDHRRPGSLVRPVPAALLRAAAADRGRLASARSRRRWPICASATGSRRT